MKLIAYVAVVVVAVFLAVVGFAFKQYACKGAENYALCLITK